MFLGVDSILLSPHALLPNIHLANLTQFSNVGVLKSKWIPEQIRPLGYEIFLSDARGSNADIIEQPSVAPALFSSTLCRYAC